MADELVVKITATDGASKVFNAVERSAEDMGKGIEEAAEKAGGEFKELVQAAQQMAQAMDRHADTSGRSMTELGRTLDRVAQSIDRAADQMGQSLTAGAREASQAIDQVEESAQRADVSLRDFSNAGREVGQGLGLLGTAFTMYAGQARDHELAVQNLSRTYGDAAGEFVALADQLQSSTIFSNDQVIQAASSFAVLRREYGLTNEQIQQLIVVSADLAAVKGIGLVDASERVQAAIRGETESAEYLGLALNATAIDVEGVTAAMSNAEAGQFRFNALLERGAFAQGEAARQTEDLTGKTLQLANRVQDAATGFVQWTGPIGEVAAGLSSFGLEAGLAVGGLARMAQGMREATSAAGGLGPAMRMLVSSPAFGLTALAAGAGLAVIAVREVARSFDDNYYQSIATAIAQTAELDATVLALIGTMNDATTSLDYRGNVDTINADIEALAGVQEKLWELEQLQERAQGAEGVWGSNIPEDLAADIAAVESELAALEAQYGELIPAQQAASEAASAYQTILENTAPGADAARVTAANLFDQYQRGEISLMQLRDALNGVVADLPNYTTQALEAQAATEQQTAALEEQITVLGENAEAWDELIRAQNRAGTTILTPEEGAENARREAVLQMYRNLQAQGLRWLETLEEIEAAEAAADAANQDRLAGTIDRLQELEDKRGGGREDREITWHLNIETDEADGRSKIRPTADALYEVDEAADTATRSLGDYSLQVGELGEMVAAQALPWAAYQQALAGVAEEFGILSTNARLFQAAGIQAPSLDVAVNLQGGEQALDSVFGTIVGQTNRMSQQLGSVESWADKLIGDPGTWSQLDQLLQDGRISLEQYNDAQRAQVRISTDVENAQQDLLAVQANLAPVIADATRQQAEYIDQLQDRSEAEQLAALGFMDQAQSAKALEVAQLAAASSTEAQREATTKMINEMAAADPVLAAMLVQMGLISEVKPGVYEVNFDDAVSATDAIEGLNSSIEDLTALLEEIFNVDTDTDAPATQRLVESLTGAVNDIPDKVTTTVNLIDNASFQAGLIRDTMNLLDGKTATTFVNTVYSVSGNPQLAVTRRHGGTIPEYANGGVIASLAEAGPELLRFRDGGQALVPHPGVYMVQPGTSVLPAPATAAVMDRAAPRGGGSVNYYGPVSQTVTYDQSSFAQRRAGLRNARGY